MESRDRPSVCYNSEGDAADDQQQIGAEHMARLCGSKPPLQPGTSGARDLLIIALHRLPGNGLANLFSVRSIFLSSRMNPTLRTLDWRFDAPAWNPGLAVADDWLRSAAMRERIRA